jgi:hypothetical protein
MKTSYQSARHGEKGYALVITMLFLLVTLVTLTGMWFWTSTNGSLTQRNNTFNQSAAAAEAATEKVFTTMDRDFLYGVLNTNASYYATNIPDTTGTNFWPVQYAFSDGLGGTNRIYVSMSATNHYEPLNSQYAGLIGLTIDCTNIAIATPKSQRYNVGATVQQTFQASVIPVFQFAIFYNLNLEMAAGNAQTIQGPVFCNASIWEGSAALNFSTNVEAVGTNFTSSVDPFNSTYTNGSAAIVGSTADFSGTPQANFAPNTQGNPKDNATALTLPIAGATNSNPTNVEAILNLPPAALSVANTSAGYATTNQIYLYNECDLIISNASIGTNYGVSQPNNTNIFIYFSDVKHAPNLTPLTPDFYILNQAIAGTGIYTNFVWPNTALNRLNYTNRCATNVLYAGWSFATNVAFYDYRESDTVQALQIDIAKLNIWLTNSAASNNASIYNNLCYTDRNHWIDSVYAYNNVPLTAGQLPAVRLINGKVLPTFYGLTVATPQPVYIYGDYNVRTNATLGGDDTGLNATTHTYPAAVLADAVTILSTSWNDTQYTNGYSYTLREPNNTTVNAAMLEGIVQTDPTIHGDYSGGAENFLRLLEDWGGSGAGGLQTLTYNGSIVVMFPSIYATNHWGQANVYSVPTRHWAFDLNFAKTDGSGLPPSSPSARALVRGNWSAY